MDTCFGAGRWTLQDNRGASAREFAGETRAFAGPCLARQRWSALYTKAHELRYELVYISADLELTPASVDPPSVYTYVEDLACGFSKAHAFKQSTRVRTHYNGTLSVPGLSCDYLNATSVLSRPLICWFASYGCTGACRKLLAAKVNPDIRELNFEAGNPTALLLAARGGFPDCVAALIDGGAAPHLTDEFGVTPLHEAAGSPGSNDDTHAAVMSILLQHPSAHKMLHKVDAAGQSPLASAAAQGFTACIKLLLEAYSPPLRQQMASKALVSAAEAGCTAAVEALITAGAVSVPNADSPSALEVPPRLLHLWPVQLLCTCIPGTCHKPPDFVCLNGHSCHAHSSHSRHMMNLLG